MSLYKRNGIWWLDISVDGERRRVSTNSDSKSIANKFEREYRAGVIGGEIPSNISTKGGLTLADAFDRAYRTSWREHKDLTGYITNGKQLEQLLGGKVLLKTITSKTIAKLKEDLMGMNYAPATVNNKMACLSSLLHIACDEWEELDAVPTFKRLKTRNQRMRTISPAEEAEAITWFMENGEPLMADLVVLLVDTGMRLGEAMRITPSHIDFKRKFLRVFKTKNDEARSVPLTDRVIGVLNKLKDNEELIFSEWDRDGATYRWTKMSEKVGKKDDKEYVLHALRHTCATRLLEAGVDIYTVKEWLGHKDINTTMRYAKMTNLKLNEALTKLEGARA